MKNSIVTKYYFAGSTRLAVRTDGTLRFLLGDHLGSSSVTTNASGAKTASALYKAFGETRFTAGTLSTDYKFTGQREESALGGIYFFQSRWFDPTLGRFMSPDSIVPTSTQGTQAWDRYAFVNNNPVRYTDPTGHEVNAEEEEQDDENASGNMCEGSQSEDMECLWMGAYTEGELGEMAEHFEDLAATDRALAIILAVVIAKKYGDPGLVPGAAGGFAVEEMANERDEVAGFFDDASDDAHDAKEDLIIGLYYVNKDVGDLEQGFYLKMPSGAPLKVEWWQLVDLLDALITHD